MIVESGIPIPTNRSTRQRSGWNPDDFPFGLMEVGDSFAVSPPEGVHLIYVQNKITGAASKLHRETDKKFTTRQTNGQVRCWRVE